MLQCCLLKWFSFLVAILFLASYDLLAQQNKIDSLDKILRTQPEDTLRVKALNAMAYLHINKNPELIKQYADSALKMALKLIYPYSIANSYKSLGIYFYMEKLRACLR